MESTVSPFAKTIPEILFMIYQMTFAVITCALVARLGRRTHEILGICWFMHRCWLVHRLCAVRALGLGRRIPGPAGPARFRGRDGRASQRRRRRPRLRARPRQPRRGYGRENLSPFDLSLAVIGTGLLWVGWFGFNGGSALAANSRAVFAIVATHLAACAGALVWSGWNGCSAASRRCSASFPAPIAGLGTITPASGYVLPWHGVVIGIDRRRASAIWACTVAEAFKLGYDDTLDVFGVHGVGGIDRHAAGRGLRHRGISASAEVPDGFSGLLENNAGQVAIQFYGAVVTAVWSGGVTWILLKVIGALVPLRVTQQSEVEGLDITQHGEALQ